MKPNRASESQYRQIVELRSQGKTYDEIQKLVGCTTNTIWKAIQRNGVVAIPGRKRFGATNEEQATIELIKKLREEGTSYNKIASVLNEQNRPTQTGCKWATGSVFNIFQVATNPEWITSKRLINRKHQIRRKYGLDVQEFQKLIDHQNNMCAICKSSLDDDLNVDHDHTSGVVRGLLCTACNTGLGSFRDSIDALRGAIDYLQVHLGMAA